VLADHGNAEKAINSDGSPNTSHTLNPVPCIYIGYRNLSLKNGILADVAPTLLELLGINKPDPMTGTSLIY
jgi:2,3-bisphosphoglycerate-independent phosphoglycerate mutase